MNLLLGPGLWKIIYKRYFGDNWWNLNVDLVYDII